MSFINRNHDHGHGGAAGYSMTKSINAFHQRAMVHEITGPIALPHALLTAYRDPEIDMFLKGNERLSPTQGWDLFCLADISPVYLRFTGHTTLLI